MIGLLVRALAEVWRIDLGELIDNAQTMGIDQDEDHILEVSTEYGGTVRLHAIRK